MKKNNSQINLPECTVHFRPLEIVCANQSCQKPRLGCTRCFYDKTHKECKFNTILIEDFVAGQYNESLDGWIKEESHRKELEKIWSIYPGNLSNHYDELKKIVENRFSEIEKNFKSRLESIKLEILSIIKKKVVLNESFCEFRDHFNIQTLIDILSSVSLEELETINKKTMEFFSMDINSFLIKWKNEKDLIYFSKPDYSSFILKRESLYNKLFKNIETELLSLSNFQSFFVPETKINICKRFKKLGNSWGYTGDKYDCISFKSTKNILFHGFGIFSPSKKNEKIIVSFQINEGNNSDESILIKGEINVIGKDNENNSQCMIEPLILKKERSYSICLIIEGADSYNGIEGEEIINCEDVNFIFFETNVIGENKNNNTNVNHGQISEIYYTVLS